MRVSIGGRPGHPCVYVEFPYSVEVNAEFQKAFPKARWGGGRWVIEFGDEQDRDSAYEAVRAWAEPYQGDRRLRRPWNRRRY